MHGAGAEDDDPFFVGIDIAAKTLTARWMAAGERAERPLTLTQTAEGFATVRTRLLAGGTEAGQILVVMEATGSYWMALATDLAQAGFAVSVINPKQAHDVAKACAGRVGRPREKGAPCSRLQPTITGAMRRYPASDHAGVVTCADRIAHCR